MWDQDVFTIAYKDNLYIFTKLGLDISESWGKPLDSVFIEYKIEGPSKDVYLIIDYSESKFTFAQKANENYRYDGIYVSLDNEEMNNFYVDMVYAVNERMGNE